MKKGKRLVGMGHKIKKNKLENRRRGKKKNQCDSNDNF
jgi:hypothetical protein